MNAASKRCLSLLRSSLSSGSTYATLSIALVPIVCFTSSFLPASSSSLLLTVVCTGSARACVLALLRSALLIVVIIVCSCRGLSGGKSKKRSCCCSGKHWPSPLALFGPYAMKLKNCIIAKQWHVTTARKVYIWFVLCPGHLEGPRTNQM